ncbi:MAG TPA: hypothetical protein VF077_05400 [Nitrospiraceae bacterium]
MPEEQQPNPLQQRIEHDVRVLIGDLQMQLVVMRALLDQQKEGQVPAPEIKPNGGTRPTVAP